MDEADLYADEIAVINLGKIVTRGTSEGLKHSLGGEVIFQFRKCLTKAWVKRRNPEIGFCKRCFCGKFKHERACREC